MSIRRFAAAALALAAAVAPAAMADPFRVNVDQTVTMRLNAPASSIVLGNATVVDVTIHDRNTLLITGKGFGTTNLIVLDASGRQVLETQLVVGANNPGQLTVVRGAGANTYSCIDKCRSTPMVGDSPEYFSGVLATVQGKAAAARGQ